MLTEERHDWIRNELKASGKVVSTDLAERFGVSEDTVRRDLRELAKAGFCRRVYGGALLPAPDLGSITERRSNQVEDKQALAAVVAGLFQDGQTTFVDAGSTNIAVVQAISRDKSGTIITNAPEIAIALRDHHRLKTIMLGGEFNPSKGACIGGQTIRQARRINADMLVLGACGLDPRAGVTALDNEEAELKRCLVEQSASLVIAATPDKLGTIAPYAIVGADAIDHLAVSSQTSVTFSKAFSAMGVKVHRTIG